MRGLRASASTRMLIGRETRAWPRAQNAAPHLPRPRGFLRRPHPDRRHGGGDRRRGGAGLGQHARPVAATRPAVNEEVRLFRSRHPDRPVIPVMIEGTWPDNFSACAALRAMPEDGSVTDRPMTILGPDLRESADGKNLGLAKAIAGLTGLGADDIFRRAERARRRRARIWAGIADFASCSPSWRPAVWSMPGTN